MAALIGVISIYLSYTDISQHIQQYIVGASSLFLYGKYQNFLKIAKYLSVLFIASADNRNVLLNPLFIIHLLSCGNDFLLLLPLFMRRKNRIIRTILFMIVAITRQILIDPNPSIGMVWLIDAHEMTGFQKITRIAIAFYQLFLLFISRHNANEIFSVSVLTLLDPCPDFSMLSLALFEAFKLRNKQSVKIAFALIFTGFFFEQAAFFSWFKMRIGNANFAMVGSLIINTGITTLMTSEKC